MNNTAAVVASLWLGLIASAAAQPQPGGPGDGQRPRPQGPGPASEERKLVAQFDNDGDERLNREERAPAREFLRANPTPRMGPRRPEGEAQSPPPGPSLSPGDVQEFPHAGPYDVDVLRTIFLTFENTDWEAELADFYNSDVEVPALMVVDGVEYPGVGVSFRGASSFFMVASGRKRSLNVSVDASDEDQRLYGARTLNLLNGHGDPSMLSSVLFSELARRHLPAPRANFVRVVINGESWGIFVSAEQFNRDFVERHYGSGKGARWKVSGSPNGRSGLDFVGDDLAEYRRRYQIRSGDKEEDWRALINLCRVLSTAPLEDLEEQIGPILDVDEVLWFLALDCALVNSDGYWVRASDFSIFKDEQGVFHLMPHDMNEAFSSMTGGPGGRRAQGGGRPGGPPPDGAGPRGDGPPPGPDQPRNGGPGRGRGRAPGWELDPLVGMDDESKPLRSRLLAVPELREQYLRNVRTIAREMQDLEILIDRCRGLIGPELAEETRSVNPYEAFERATGDGGQDDQGRARPSLRSWIQQRSRFLLQHPEIVKLGAPAEAAP